MNGQDKTISSSGEHRNIEDLVRINRLLESEKKSLETMILQERDFLAKMVHEARCHVQGIFWGLNSLFDIKSNSGREAEYRRLLCHLRESTLKYKNLLHNITDYSANQYGRNIVVKMETVPVNDYLQSIVEDLSYYLTELGHTLHVQYAMPSFEAILDTMRFRQVVHNLLINATQHGETGIINVAVSADPFTKIWSLTINNPHKQQRQKESNRNANQGLGLMISWQLIELMKGAIDIKPEGHLFTVTIRMPLDSVNK